jgi:hypothetical protein
VKLLTFITAISLCTGAAWGESSYTRSARRAYLSQVLDAATVMAAPQRRTLRAWVHSRALSRCRAGFEGLSTSCLHRAAKKHCERKKLKKQTSCSLVADLIVVNELSEREFVGKAERYRLMQEPDGFRAAILVELAGRYAELALEMALSPAYRRSGGNVLVATDEFCVARARHSTQHWQRCSAAIVWHVATTGKEAL